MIWPWVAVAGGLGAAARYIADGYLTRSGPRGLPTATLVINVVGSFALGVVLAATAPGIVRAVIGVGFLGGFTTFSTASVELVRLARTGRPWVAVVLGVGMAALSLGAAVLGLALGHAVA